ncbi:uncharacterized protein LOC142239825 [Haematobia irritans]|uniref:uncharacterized protein LOC142239825 n=1 Tax=Haematobia irritans TaxID=7368 RepID=UPI003F50BA51
MLADPSSQNSAKIDVVLGAEFYFHLLLSGTLHLADNLPVLKNTKFGWIASGRLAHDSTTEATCAVFSEDDTATNELLEKFWKIEEVPAESNLTVAEQACETHVIQTTTRELNGRFVVRLPLSEDAATLGESETSAYSRFLALERRFKRDNNLEKQYKDFMQSYEDLGHMTQIDPKSLPGPRYYIPHHCVLRPESSTTKLRVLFDASAKTSTNRSLNDWSNSEAGFKLRKWCANHRQLLQDIPQDDQEVNLDFENASIKALGLIWSPASDQFCLRAILQPVSVIAKRSVISDVARIYDPLGIAGPVVVAAKIFIQQLWEDQISWDDELPEDRTTKWHAFRNAVNTLDNTRIPRHVFDGQTAQHIQMHVFVHATEKAYGAAIYIRSKLPNKRIIVRLLCAKSRVAPLQRVSLPRLELCAALLGAELANKTKNKLRYEVKQLFFWSDSEIVLHWINSASSSLKTFVANRISKIQDLTINSQWRHVDSKTNPADLISRGLKPEQLPECNMWFYGYLF